MPFLPVDAGKQERRERTRRSMGTPGGCMFSQDLHEALLGRLTRAVDLVERGDARSMATATEILQTAAREASCLSHWMKLQRSAEAGD